jgi:hypothetical protein
MTGENQCSSNSRKPQVPASLQDALFDQQRDGCADHSLVGAWLSFYQLRKRTPLEDSASKTAEGLLS